MLKKVLIAAAVTVGLTAPALAGHCSKDAKAIDAALAKMSLMSDVKSKVMSLKDKGLALHKAGKHRQSEATLAEAMRLILTNAK